MKNVKVLAPGTCGELAQGKINGRNFHITCPVKLFTTVFINMSKDKKTVFPSDKWKSELSFKKTLQYFGCSDFGGEIHIDSEIPVGKGMASSTADITGVCLALARVLEKKISDDKIAEIALSIEPSDGVMFKNIVFFDHRKGRVLQRLGVPPEMRILIMDLGGSVDTRKFNNENYEKIYKKNENKITEAVELIKDGILYNDIVKIGKGATLSAFCNQALIYKSELEPVLEISAEMGAVGVNTAHSGTVLGILLPYAFNDMKELEERLEKKLNKKFSFYRTELAGGGEYIA
ncbi:GHMP kinase [bacterium]|nr:GHMP kinase [bacterium]MBU3955122.1 GHMP kinase [bacterium]MBU4134571.1 GHMP kinase [bacterium]